jgi:PAS domain S-box-containing protein
MDTSILASSKIRTALIAVLIGVAYYSLARIGHALSTPPDYIAIFWPPNTVILAALLLTDRRRWWIYFLAMTPAYLASALQAGFSEQRIIIFFAANCTEILVAALALKYILGNCPKFDRLREMIIFLLWAVLIAPLVSALMASTATFFEPGVNYWLTWRIWFLGDALGHLTLTPVIILWISSGLGWLKEVSFARLMEALGLVLTLLVIGLFSLGSEIGASGNFPALLYTPLPVLLWAAIRFETRGICSAVFAITLLAIWHAINGQGAFTANTPADNVLSLQLFLIAVSVPTMLLGSLLSERKKAGKALQESESLLAKAQELAKIGHWKLNPATNNVAGSDELFRIFGLNKDEATLEAFIEVVHPDDRERDVATIQRGTEFGESWDIEHRLICRDATEKWVRAIGEAIVDSGGKVIELIGTVQDVTEHKHAEERLRASQRMLETVFDNAPSMIWGTDEQGILKYFNKKSVETMGYSYKEAIGMFNMDLHPPDKRDEVFEKFEVHVAGKTEDKLELPLMTKSGKRLVGSIAQAIYEDEYGKKWYFGFIEEITERKRAEKELELHRTSLEELVSQRTAELKLSLAEKEVLLKEVHHRVKNNMAMVSAFIQLQMGQTDSSSVNSALMACDSRIRAMAMVHKKLYQSKDLTNIDMQGLYQEISDALYLHTEHGKIEIEIQAHGIYLDMDIAIPCAMIMNELLSNSLKYAFENSKSGKINIAMNKIADEKYHIHLNDNGCGLPDDISVDHTDTLGLQLVNVFIDQLNGSIALDKKDGTTFNIVFPG